eukprot:3398777-Pyramimonas_sp.AAC.1
MGTQQRQNQPPTIFSRARLLRKDQTTQAQQNTAGAGVEGNACTRTLPTSWSGYRRRGRTAHRSHPRRMATMRDLLDI